MNDKTKIFGIEVSKLPPIGDLHERIQDLERERVSLEAQLADASHYLEVMKLERNTLREEFDKMKTQHKNIRNDAFRWEAAALDLTTKLELARQALQMISQGAIAEPMSHAHAILEDIGRMDLNE